jgi:hypothetical protein
MQIRGELHDERDESSYTLQTKAKAVNDNSRRNYDNDKASTSRRIGLRDIPSSFSPMENNKIAYRVFYFQLCRP